MELRLLVIETSLTIDFIHVRVLVGLLPALLMSLSTGQNSASLHNEAIYALQIWHLQ